KKEIIESFDSRADAEKAEVRYIKSATGQVMNHRLYVRTESVQVDRTESDLDRTESVHGQKTDLDRTESVQVDRTESVHTKDNLPKDNLQKNCTEELSLSMQDDPREPTPIAKLPLVDGSEHAIHESQAREWSLAYPAVDV